MAITSIYYLVFLAGAILIYWIIPSKIRWYFLLVCSLLFYYFCGDIRTIIYVCVTVITVYCATWFIMKRKSGQKLVFISTLCINVGLLAVLKYNVFFINVVNIVLRRNYKYIELIAPLAVSYYTLQILGYFIDCYKMRNDSKQLEMYMEKNPLKLFLFTTFFPLMTSGPISQYDKLKNELFESHTIDYDLITNGLKRIAGGIIKKRVIADPLALPVEVVFNNFSTYDGICIWLGTVMYGIQLYMDFSGCMDIVIGTANCFGMRLSENFNSPYLACSIKDFWRRWHISLSTWLKNYIYIPLGGNKKGVLIKYRNILITFLVSGLWHGGAFKFIFWGGYTVFIKYAKMCLTDMREENIKKSGTRYLLKV